MNYIVILVIASVLGLIVQIGYQIAVARIERAYASYKKAIKTRTIVKPVFVEKEEYKDEFDLGVKVNKLRIGDED